ncbi:MAG: helix-turn-helix domain-containing protein [Turicibacter sp.]|nr:helix-turn-helix domain-containing protein [Turicibacter sp.]
MRLKELRQERDLTLDQLAKATGIPKQQLSRYERQENEPRQNIREQLAKYFDVSVGYLMGWELPYHGISGRERLLRDLKTGLLSLSEYVEIEKSLPPTNPNRTIYDDLDLAEHIKDSLKNGELNNIKVFVNGSEIAAENIHHQKATAEIDKYFEGEQTIPNTIQSLLEIMLEFEQNSNTPEK